MNAPFVATTAAPTEKKDIVDLVAISNNKENCFKDAPLAVDRMVDDDSYSSSVSSVVVLGGKTNVPCVALKADGNDSDDDNDVVFMKSRSNPP